MPKKLFEVDRRSLKRLQNQLQATGKEVHQNVTKALEKSMRKVLAEAQDEVPVDTGRLRDSGAMRTTKRGANLQEVEVTFGGQAIRYAAKVHETHKTKSKFLERPARREAVRFNVSNEMGKLLKAALEKASRKR